MRFRSHACACIHCCIPNFQPSLCRCQNVFSGAIKSHLATRLTIQGPVVTRSKALAEFAKSIEAKQVIALRVAEGEQDEEGKFW